MANAEVEDGQPPTDFLKLTPSMFGISVESFTPVSSNQKEKSRLAQIKARRRSSIGVRGSPETNTLIRFIAQQKMKNVSQQQTPTGSPFLPRVASTLKQKMAAFQSLMDVEENNLCERIPKEDNSDGCVETGTFLADMGKENHPPVTSPAPSKRRRVGSQEVCEVEISESRPPALHLNLTELKGEDEPSPPAATSVEEATASLVSPPPFDVQDDIAEDQSSGQQKKPLIASQPQPSCLNRVQFTPSQPQMKPTGEEVKKKRVHFGDPLPPEFFDKNLPPSTPLQKGGTPARAQTPGGDLKLRSLLKTPQRNELSTPVVGQEFGSPVDVGASPKLSMPRNRRMKSLGDDPEMEDGKIFFSSMEELDSVFMTEAEYMRDPQKDLNAAFQEETLSPLPTVTETRLNPTAQTDDLNVSEPLPKMEELPQVCPEAQTGARTSNRKRTSSAALESTSEAPARSRGQKRKLSDAEPVKRSTRSAAKSAAGKMKASTTARHWRKEVNRSLYSDREYASKLPTLSPITESLSFITGSPSAEQSPAAAGPDEDPGVTQELGRSRDNSNVNCVASEDDAQVPEDSPEDSPASTNSGAEGAGEEGSESNVVESQSSVCGLNEGLKTGDDQTELSATVLADVLLSSEAVTVPEGGPHVPDSDEPQCPDAPTEARLPVSKGQTKRKPGRRRRSSVRVSEALNDAEEEETPSSQSLGCDSKDGSQEPSVTLAPWQTQVDFESVFKPVATRGQRSVRRSLRNQHISDDGSSSGGGLAWLPHTSSKSSEEPRRRSRSRRPPAEAQESQQSS
ncbi:cell division cycle-associated protein 2 [Synchiropus picturatus]